MQKLALFESIKPKQFALYTPSDGDEYKRVTGGGLFPNGAKAEDRAVKAQRIHGLILDRANRGTETHQELARQTADAHMQLIEKYDMANVMHERNVAEQDYLARSNPYHVRYEGIRASVHPDITKKYPGYQSSRLASTINGLRELHGTDTGSFEADMAENQSLHNSDAEKAHTRVKELDDGPIAQYHAEDMKAWNKHLDDIEPYTRNSTRYSRAANHFQGIADESQRFARRANMVKSESILGAKIIGGGLLAAGGIAGAAYLMNRHKNESK